MSSKLISDCGVDSISATEVLQKKIHWLTLDKEFERQVWQIFDNKILDCQKNSMSKSREMIFSTRDICE